MSFPPVADLLPQDPPMIVVDELVAFDGTRAIVRATVREGQAWVVDGRVRTTFCIEYMAQAVGCNAGMRARALGRKIRVGFLLGSRELTLATDWLYVGDEIVISARHVFGDEKLGSFECELRRGDELVAAGTLNVFAGELSEAGL